MKKLFLAEHDHQVNDFLNKGIANDGEWIALGPSAMHYLSKKGIHYTTPEDYCSIKEVEDACIPQFERLKEVCSDLDEFFLQRDSFLNEWSIRPFLFHLWQLGQLFDVLECRSLQLKKILENYHGSKVFVHAAPAQSWNAFDIRFSKDETLWGRLLQLPGWKADVYILSGQNYQSSDTAKKKVSLSILRNRIKDAISPFLSRNPMFYTLFRSFLNDYSGNVLNILKSSVSNGKNALAMMNGIYEWNTIMPNIIAGGYPVYFLYGRNLLKRSLPTNNSINRYKPANNFLKNIQDAFSGMTINYLEIFRDRLIHIIEYSSAIAKGIVKSIESLFLDKKIQCLLFSAGFDYGSYIVKQFCRRKNIKVLSWQHGAEWYDKRITQRNDLLNLVGSDKLLVYGNSVEYAYISSPLSEEEGCEVIPVGMRTLEVLKEISYPVKANRIRVLWPNGGYYSNTWYCGFSPPYNDRICYKEQMIILKNFLKLQKKYSQLSLTVKLYRGTYVHDNPPWMTDLQNINRIKIVYEKPNFVNLLYEHDIVIIESPTTTLLQAIATGLPVFVLTSIITPPRADLPILMKRAVCADNASLLMDKIEEYLRNGNYPADVNNREYLKLHGTHLDDGGSHLRALKVLNNVMDIK